MKALLLQQPGSVDNLHVGDVPDPKPQTGEIRVRVGAIGLNPVDYKLAGRGNPAWTYPHIPGLDVAGTVDAVGPDTEGFESGDRVYYHGDLTRPGGYAEWAITTAHTTAKIPEGVELATAAAIPCAGLTAYQGLIRRLDVQAGQTVWVQGGAGGVGGFGIQLCKARGATVIGTASSALKCKEITRAGAKHAIDTSKKDVAKEVAKITKGQGVDVVFDPVGKDTYETSLACLKDRGLLASFGGASGPVPDVNLNEFRYMARAWRLTRASLFNYTAGCEDLLHSSKRVFAMIRSGKVKVKIKQRYALKDAVQMHKDIESRKLTGITMLVP